MNTAATHTEQQRFQDEGFSLFAEPVLPANRVAAAREGLERIRRGEYNRGQPPYTSPWTPGDDPTRLCKIEQPQFADSAVWELLTDSGLGAAIAAVIGARMIQIWWVQLLYKPGTSGKATPAHVGWHQDWTYWSRAWADDSEVLTAWVALSDVDEASGPMLFVPGSHRWPDPGGGNFFAQDLDAQQFKVPPGAAWREAPAVMHPGGFSLHHRLTVHGSRENRTDHPRMSFAVHVRTERSHARDGKREGLTAFIDDPARCPIIYGSRVDAAFA